MSQDRSPVSGNPADELPPPGNGWSFFIVLVLVASAGYLLASMINMSPDEDRHIPQPGKGLIGIKAPPIQAQGWFNGEEPTKQDLQGKIVVIDAWAYWCRPCRRKAPALIRLYEEFNPQGVVFLGLTTEDERALQRSREFIEDTKIPWPQGYGAHSTLSQLNAEFIPQVWVIDSSGTIVWDQTAPNDLRTALRRLVK